MMGEVFRLKEGVLICIEVSYQFKFGMVYEKDGVYSVDLYFKNKDVFHLHEKQSALFRSGLKIVGETVKSEYLEFYGLSTRLVNENELLLNFDCHDCILYQKAPLPNEERQPFDKNSELYYIELEGLKLEFSNFSNKSIHRKGTSFSKQLIRDHTDSIMTVDNLIFNQTFYKIPDSDNIIVEFISDANNKMTYDYFTKIKRDYISFLSFFNGARVKIRKEHTGKFYSVYDENISGEAVIIYSFERINNNSFNHYVPIGKRVSNVPDNLLGKAFMFCFENFRKVNEKLDLSSIIYFLNTSQQVQNAEERFFIEIIAFERLTAYYTKSTSTIENRIPSKENFKLIKSELLDVLDKHKILFGSNYEKARSVLGNLNEAKRIDTKSKMYGILYDTKIIVNDDIRDLIDVVRNDAVHEGHVGTGINAIKNLFLLNEIIYEIILRLIDYKDTRIPKYLSDDNFKTK